MTMHPKIAERMSQVYMHRTKYLGPQTANAWLLLTCRGVEADMQQVVEYVAKNLMNDGERQ